MHWASVYIGGALEWEDMFSCYVDDVRVYLRELQRGIFRGIFLGTIAKSVCTGYVYIRRPPELGGGYMHCSFIF